MFTSLTKREIRHFHVVVVQRRQRNVLTGDARAKLLFFQSKPTAFSRSRCRRRCLSSPENQHKETAYFLNRCPEWIFLDSTGLVNSCGRLEPDISVHCVINSGPVLNEIFKFKMADNNVLFATATCFTHAS